MLVKRKEDENILIIMMALLLKNKIRTKDEEEEMYIHNRKTRCGKNKESQKKTEREGA